MPSWWKTQRTHETAMRGEEAPRLENSALGLHEPQIGRISRRFQMHRGHGCPVVLAQGP